MKNTHRILIGFMLFFESTQLALAQETFLCISEAAGGVAFDSTTNKWKGTAFKNNNEKFILTFKNGKWIHKSFEFSFESECTVNEGKVMRCKVLFGEFFFNMNTNRYLNTYIAGYIDGKDNKENTPLISIGACSKL